MISEFNLRKPQKSYLPLDGPAHHKSDSMDAYWGSFLSVWKILSPVFFTLVQLFQQNQIFSLSSKIPQELSLPLVGLALPSYGLDGFG